MADKQKEEDDDEGFVFGDFTSAPKTPANQVNGSDLFTQTKNDGGDDDWSDFVTFNQSRNANSITDPSNTSNSTQLTNSVTDQQVELSAPESDRFTESKPNQWVKLRGAIPLSIFGEEEEEKDESSAVDSSFNDKAQFLKSDLMRKDSNLNKSVEISSLIKDLYGSKDNGNRIKTDSSEQIGNGSVAKPNSNGTGFDLVNGSNQGVEGDERDDWEWEFKCADGERDGRTTDSILKENESRAVNSMAFNFETSTSQDGFNSDVAGTKRNSAMMNFSTNGFKYNSAKEQDFRDDGWAFMGPEKSHAKVETFMVREDDSWDFKGAKEVSRVEPEASKEDKSKAANSMAFNCETSTSQEGCNSDVVGSKKNSAMMKFDTNGFKYNSTKEQDIGYNGWAFVGPEERHMKVGISLVKEDDSRDFKGAKDISRVKVEASKEDESKAANSFVFNFETSTNWDGFNSDVVGSKTNPAMMNIDTNGFKYNSTKEQDIGDDGSAFTGAEESHMKLETSMVKEDDGWDFKNAEKVSCIKIEASKEDRSKATNGFAFNFETSAMSLSGFNSNVIGSTTNSAVVNFDINGFNFNSAKEQDDEDDSWDFKGAEESHVKVETSDVKHDDSWDSKGAEAASHIEVGTSKDLQESWKSSQMLDTTVGLTNDMFGETNLFVSPNGSSHQIGNVGFSKGFPPSHTSQDKIVLDIHATIKPKEIKYELNSNSVSAAPFTPSHQEISESKQRNQTGALPLSIFGDEALENDDSIIQDDISNSVPANSAREEIKVTKTQSISDLISSLYSQSAQNASINSIPGVHALNSTSILAGENLADEEDDFDDSWDFKGASTATSNESQTYGNCDQARSDNVMVLAQPIAEPNVVNHDDSIDSSLWEFKDASLGTVSRDFLESHQNLELDELWKFYSQLRDELHLVVSHHLDNMKKNNGLLGFAGEDAQGEVHNGEIQELYNEMYNSEIDSVSLSRRKIDLNGILEVLQEKKFQFLEAEYQLSNRLSLAETDTNSLVEVLRHVSSVLRILQLGSREGHSSYISTWSKILSVCAKELKLGASIWKQAVDKKIQSQLLAESKGKKYILALGEIYRVVGILRASAKVYKPWLFTDSISSSQIHALLGVCSMLWSSSGLEEAIRSMSAPLEFHYEGTAETLLESIERVHNLDMPLLKKTTLSHSESLCQLSLLSPVSVPGMQMVSWNGKQYFLKLANLWANTVSSQPPDLPCICIG